MLPNDKMINNLQQIKKIDWTKLLDGTQKTLNIINQAIPIIYQIKPIIENAKTFINIANVLNEKDEEEEIKKTNDNASPIFYL